MLIQANESKNEKYQSGTFTRLALTIIGPLIATVATWLPDLANIKVKIDVNDDNDAFNVTSENALVLALYAAAGDALIPALVGIKSINSRWHAAIMLELPTALRMSGEKDQITLEITNNTSDAINAVMLKGMAYSLGRPFIVAKTLESNKSNTKMPFSDHVSRVVLADCTQSSTPIISAASLFCKQYSENYSQYDLLALAFSQTDSSFLLDNRANGIANNSIYCRLPVALAVVLHNSDAIHDLTVTIDKNGTANDLQFCVVGGFIPIMEKIENAHIRSQKHDRENLGRVQKGKK